MCGISGIIGKSSIKQLEKMLATQSHRGPDNTSIWEGEDIKLGHNRLSIIDLSEQANQPFETENYVLVFNGEIYNYIELKEDLKKLFNFKTTSDTEVLLAAYENWGSECLQYLNGMFSFAIWDKKNNSLFAARDRFGVKPFYYCNTEDTFSFASEIKTLFASGIKKEMDKKVWANYFVYGSYGMPNQTFWKNIQQLAGGHYLEYKGGELVVKKWYVFEDEVKKYTEIESFEKVKEKYTELLRSSIKLRFRSDVPVGFNISGGVDSSILLTFVNQLNKGKTDSIEAFTFYANSDKYDELPWVEDMISQTKNPLNKVLISSNDIENLSSNVANYQDEPFGGIPTLAYAKIFSEARGKGTIVLLDGQGMDEQWAGYDYYLNDDQRIVQGINSSPFKANVISKEMLELAEKPIYPTPFDDALLNKQYRDLFYTKIPRALRFNDRVSMGSSTELREPFLDYRLVEYAFAQPREYKIKKNIQKYMLREIVSEQLGDFISYAPKRALQTPQREWLGEELKEFVKTQLDKIKKSEVKTWFNFDELNKEWENYLDGDNESSFHIWQWVSLGLLV